MYKRQGWGRLTGRDAYLDVIRGLARLTTDRRWVLRSVELARSEILLEIDVVGTDEDGGPFVLPFISVLVLGDRGIERQDLYAPEQRDMAEWRFRPR